MRRLDLTKTALDFLTDLDAKPFRQVARKMLALLADATPADSAKLTGYDYLRVDSGEYRIVYRFDVDTVYVILIGKRDGDEVYKQLKRR